MILILYTDSKIPHCKAPGSPVMSSKLQNFLMLLIPILQTLYFDVSLKFVRSMSFLIGLEEVKPRRREVLIVLH